MTFDKTAMKQVKYILPVGHLSEILYFEVKKSGPLEGCLLQQNSSRPVNDSLLSKSKGEMLSQ